MNRTVRNYTGWQRAGIRVSRVVMENNIKNSLDFPFLFP